ncbi:hypothetical protein CRG98_042751 [Punica granatum]|uniref:EF-hand domain-containing protein n=1 Tax=Punica granatum TaxID=22663 RepID=A0A2I0HYM1_PUNGR|nr:hypothetical protein CRG98_042751 [Punica granatum]
MCILGSTSFEHEFLEDEGATEQKDSSSKNCVREPEKQNTVWNAKVILMSGLSRSALEDLSSDKSFGDWVPHICNIIRFAVLKKDHCLMAIGGPWNSTDGSDPSVDASSLVKTAMRYAKDVTQLDLQNCRNWNSFLEIHYERIGKDGLFSHKEVTVIFVPDLSDCLPSVESWRQQCNKIELDDLLLFSCAILQRLGDKAEVAKEKDLTSPKVEKTVAKSEKKKESASLEQAGSAKEGSSNGTEYVGDKKKGEKGETSEHAKDNKEKENNSNEEIAVPEQAVTKPIKKKIIRKVVKSKAGNKTSEMENSASKQSEKPNNKNDREKESLDASDCKTFVRKKVVKKASAAENFQKKDEQFEEKSQMEGESTEGEAKEKVDSGVKQESGVKTTVKRKVIKKVPKKKAADGEAIVEGGGKKAGGGDSEKVTEVNKMQKKVVPKGKPQTSASEKQDSATISSAKAETQDDKEDKKAEKGAADEKHASTKADMKGEKGKSATKEASDGKKLKDGEKSKDEKEKKSAKSDEAKEKKKNEEPPRPGFILRTEGSKDSKLRSTSLSLDSLLDYSDKDMEESTFEISLFAESLYEMFQYQMGCRLLDFLQKLRVKFVMKRNQRKRRLEETHERGSDAKPSTKLPKTSEDPVKSNKSASPEKSNSAQPNDEQMKDKEEDAPPVERAEDANMDDKEDDAYEEDPEEDPEEDLEECEELDDGAPEDDPSNEETEQKEDTGVSAEPENKVGGSKDDKEEADEPEKEKSKVTSAAETKQSSDVDMAAKKEEKTKQDHVTKEAAMDKELLQAFRFFDRNRVGYIRVEDLRLILHTLGKFLSHRDVKELVQSALLESSTGRDDRIIYDKLVRMSV